jgi:hypothetical protein
MAGDDETIVIRVNAAQGEAALKALGAAGVKAASDITGISEAGSKSVSSFTDKYAALGAKIFGITKVVQSAGEAVKEVAIATGNYSGATKDAIDQVSNLASSIGSLDLAGTAKALGQLAGQTLAWARGINDTTLALGNLVDLDAVSHFKAVLAIQNDMVEAHGREVAALGLVSEALSRQIAAQQKSGEVQKFVKDKLKETLDAYEKTGATVDPILAKQAADLGILSTAQEKAAESAEDHAKRAEEAAQKRAKAELEAIDAVLKKMEEEAAARQKAIADAQAHLAEVMKPQPGIDTSAPTDDLNKSIQEVSEEIQALERQDFLSPDQLNQLDAAKDRASDLNREMGDLNKTFTVTRDTFIDDAQAAQGAAAAFELYNRYAEENEAVTNAANDAILNQTDSIEGLADQAREATGYLQEVAEAGEDVGGGIEKGVDRAKEGVNKLLEGIEEALPLAKELLEVGRQIQAVYANIDI